MHSYLVGINCGLAFIYLFTFLVRVFVKQRFLASIQRVNLPLVTDNETLDSVYTFSAMNLKSISLEFINKSISNMSNPCLVYSEML